ncbi:MAG: PEP-CTERM sorting domain-containing protein [Pirellulales bacterium]
MQVKFILSVLSAVMAFGVAQQAIAEIAPVYAVTGLGALPGDTSSIAYGINEAGVIVGSSSDAGGSNTIAGFKWQAGVMTDLGLYTGHTAIRPWDVNASGNVTGRATGGAGGSNYGVYHDGAGWQLAGWVGGTRGNGFGINDSNQMVGNMRLPSGDYSRAFVWSPVGGTVQLPTIHPDDPGNAVPAYGGFEGGSYATGINASGVVVGSSGISDTHGSDRGFKWTTSGGMTNLGTPASQGLAGLADFTQSYAQNLNDTGLIVGAADRGSGLTRAVYWDTNDVIHDIGTLGGNSGWAYAVNDDNVIVGFSNNGSGNRGFVFMPGGTITDLNTLLASSASGWVITRAYDLNNRGLIVGEGTFNGVTQAVVLTPVPEPATLPLLAAAGVVALRGIRRSRLRLGRCVSHLKATKSDPSG